MIELIHNENNCAWTGTGVKSIVTWLMNNWVDEGGMGSIVGRKYRGSSGLGTPNPGQPQGLAVVRVSLLASLARRIFTNQQQLQWLKPQPEDGLEVLGRIQTFFNSDTPNRDQTFAKKISQVGGT